MNVNTSETLEDDDDEVEIVSVSYNGNNNQSCNSDSRHRKNISRASLPPEMNGYTKPSYPFYKLITQVLSTCPKRQATALKICELIEEKLPYFKHLSSTYYWQGNVYAALRKKKFFKIIGANDQNEYIWSFNPTFEKYMIEKWMPKYLQRQVQPKPPNPNLSSTFSVPWRPKCFQMNPSTTSVGCSVIVSPGKLKSTTVSSQSIPVILNANSGDSFEPLCLNPSSSNAVTVNSASAETFNPSIVSTVSLKPISTVNEDSLLGPETTEESQIVIQSSPGNTVSDLDSGIQQALHPWEPEITVSENKQKAAVENLPLSSDFSLSNMFHKFIILKEETDYRERFKKDYQAIEKFRLHCTICDDHLGTSGSVMRRKVRFHPTLGVLVCLKCYEVTCNRPPLPETCHWCASRVCIWSISCTTCPAKLCKDCIERNFGKHYCEVFSQIKDWNCFLCNISTIWPHRAIAYLLYLHYRELKEKKKKLTERIARSPKELRFFIQDLTVCCKGILSSDHNITEPESLLKKFPNICPLPVLPSSLGPPNLAKPVGTSTTLPSVSDSSSQTLYISRDQVPKYIVVQTSSLTMNTGTQYVHNVYSDSNCVLMNPAPSKCNFQNFVNPNAVFNTQPTADISNMSNVLLQSSTEKCLDQTSQQSFYTDPKSVSVQTLTHPTVSVDKPTLNLETNKSAQDKAIIIPDLESQNEFIELKKLLRERIQKKAMPKSKKQSLLRSLLTDGKIELIKKYLYPHTNPHNEEVNELVTKKLNENIGCHESVEPILKSITETDNEYLVNPKTRQTEPPAVMENNDSVSSQNTKSESVIDLTSNDSHLRKETCDVPKIKIKTLQELQDPKVFSKSCNISEKCVEMNSAKISNIECEIIVIENKKTQNGKQPEDNISKNNDSFCDKQSEFNVPLNNNSLSKNQHEVNDVTPKDNSSEEQSELNTFDNKDCTTEIDITVLKQGIIDSTSNLINTQKKLKELAQEISNKLMCKPIHTIDLIRQFYDILNTCRSKFEKIDDNIKIHFGHLIPDINIDSIMESLKKSRKDMADFRKMKALRKKKKLLENTKPNGIDKKGNSDLQTNLRVLESDVFDLNKEDSTDSVLSIEKIDFPSKNIKQSVHNNSPERQRDQVDFNPLGKKVILGSPEITEEDLRNIPNAWSNQHHTATVSGIKSTSIPQAQSQSLQELIQRQTLLRRKAAWKKKNIWLTKKRKKSSKTRLNSTENGSVTMKKRKRRRKRRISEDELIFPSHIDHSNSSTDLRCKRRRLNTSNRPLRSSARMHPSTAALTAQFSQCDFNQDIASTVINYVIKPCSVRIERLDPRVEQILKRSIRKF